MNLLEEEIVIGRLVPDEVAAKQTHVEFKKAEDDTVFTEKLFELFETRCKDLCECLSSDEVGAVNILGNMATLFKELRSVHPDDAVHTISFDRQTDDKTYEIAARLLAYVRNITCKTTDDPVKKHLLWINEAFKRLGEIDSRLVLAGIFSRITRKKEARIYKKRLIAVRDNRSQK